MLIGLNGRKQAGKDTVYNRAAWIMRDVLRVERASFADLLYRSAAASLNVSTWELGEWKSNPEARVEVWEGEHRKTRLTIREYLQRYGTEAHRDVFGSEFWVDEAWVTFANHEGRLAMVTDCRFANEAKAIHRAGGVVVEVIGPMGRATDDAHPSEAPLPKELIDATITNFVRGDGFRALDAQVDTLLRVVLKAVPAC